MKSTIFVIAALFIVQIMLAQNDSIHYFGQTPPGDSAIVFAPGIISLPDRLERTPNYMPDYSEFYFTLTVGGARIYSAKYTDQWSDPTLDSSFRTNVSDFSISGNGNYACFTSWEGAYISGSTVTDIWMTERTDTGWSEPEKLPAPVNSNVQEWGACILENRTVYVCKLSGTNPNYHYDIVKYVYNNGNYTPVYIPEINSSAFEWDPFIPEDESYIIFKSNRQGADMDLYITYRKPDGKYTEPVNLGNKINSPYWDDCGNVTPDGKYFMFSRSDQNNTWRDIYWVNTDFIDDLKPDDLKAYLEQRTPDETPVVFAPGLLSKTGRKERTLTFTPDGKEIYFTVINAMNDYTIKYFKETDGVWQDEETAPFISQYMGSYSCLEPFISYDGTKMLFSAKPSSLSSWDYDLYITERDGENWGQPEKLGSSINTSSGEWHPCITNNGNIYFARDADIYMSEYNETGYRDAVSFDAVNSSSNDWDPYVDPDENYVIFKSNRNGGYGQMDNYISFRDIPDNTWSAPVNLGSVINSGWVDDAGDLSPDGKYFFYSRTNDAGEMDVYWIKSDFIDELNPYTSIKATINDERKLWVFPNPAQNTLQIEYPGLLEKEATYKIIDLNGNLIQYGILNGNMVDVSKIECGMYLINLKINRDNINKIIVLN